jgi:hypothetical protein
MNEKDKRLAEAVLACLCQGAQIDGIRFGPVLQILITDHASGKHPIAGQIYLNLGSKWTVFDSAPASLPDSESELPEMTEDQQIQAICSMRGLTITSIELGKSRPHLIMTLEDGRVFFLNGRHDKYEAWQLGVAMGDPSETWLVVAVPGGDIVVWAPANLGT